MSSFENNGITAKGNNLLAKVAAGKIKLNYTKAVIGDGSLGQEQSIASLTNLISPKNTVSINRLVAVSGDPAWATVGFVYSNQNITSSYFLREIGIFATDPDEGEILYWYGNAGATADFIKPGTGGSDIIEKKFDVGIYVGESANVTATIDGSLVFPTYEEFDAAIAAAKKYTDEKFASIIIESATTSRPGVTKLSNSVTSLSQNEASTPLATKTAMDKANKAEGDAESARQRAVSAEESAKNASLPRTGGTVSGALKVNGELTFADGGTATQLKQSVSDGKAKLKETIVTDKGGTVSQAGSVPTFDELDAGIKSIQQGVYQRIQPKMEHRTTVVPPRFTGVIREEIAYIFPNVRLISCIRTGNILGQESRFSMYNYSTLVTLALALRDVDGRLWIIGTTSPGNTVHIQGFILSMDDRTCTTTSHRNYESDSNTYVTNMPPGFKTKNTMTLCYVVTSNSDSNQSHAGVRCEEVLINTM